MRREQSELYKKRFLDALVREGTLTGGCREIGLSRTTVYKWLKIDKEFAELVEQAEQTVADNLEHEAIRRAYDGSDTLLIFLLKGLRPEKYREYRSYEHTGKDGKALTFTVRYASDTDERAADYITETSSPAD